MKTTAEPTPNQIQAKALLADILSSPATALPRRETLVEWLKALLARSNQKDYVVGETESADLIALDRFLRTNNVPVATG